MEESSINDNIRASKVDVKRRKRKENIYVLLSNNSRGISLHNLKSSSKNIPQRKYIFLKAFKTRMTALYKPFLD